MVGEFKKIAEEAGEVVAAASEPGEAGRAHLVHEVADLLFHTLVMLGHRDIPWADVEAELARRFGVPGVTRATAEKRLSIVETLMVGPRQRLFIVRRDNVEHLVLSGPEGATVIENGIKAQNSLQNNFGVTP